MERHPRQVDIEVTRPIGETLTGKDSQLDEAVRVLMKKLGRRSERVESGSPRFRSSERDVLSVLDARAPDSHTRQLRA